MNINGGGSGDFCRPIIPPAGGGSDLFTSPLLVYIITLQKGFVKLFFKKF